MNEAFNPNVAGGTFAALLAAAAGALIFGAPGINTPRRLALLLLIVLLGLDLALTQSRAAILAAAFAIVLLAALHWKWGWVLAAIGAAASGAFILYLGPGIVRRSLTDVTGGAATFTSREEMWLRARLLIADFTLTGTGVGTFPAVIAALYPMKGSPNHAHNLFLQLGADLGVPGLLAWLGFFFILTGMALKLLRRPAAGALYPILGGAALGFNAVLVLHGLLDCVLWGTRPALLVWILWGLTATAWNLADSSAAGGSAQPQIPTAQSPGAE
jgi:putative inorganic carbon (HCO3(-)) transporter